MTTSTVLRTADERFADLPDFNFEPTYVDDIRGYEGLRGHYLDIGPRDADRVFLCLHGEPTWSFLYRKMIPAMLESGARVVAPDLFGFGRSDKPTDPARYGFHFHRDYLLRLVERIDIQGLTLVVQDWGGTIGLTLPADPSFRRRMSRLLVMNTVICDGRSLGPHYDEWREQVRRTPDMPVGEWMQQAEPSLSEREAAAYDAPFPDIRYKVGAHVFPELAMVKPGMEGVEESRAAIRFWREDWSGPTFMAIGANDPDAGAMEQVRAAIRGCPEPMMIKDCGHFVPECGEQVVKAALQHFRDLEAHV